MGSSDWGYTILPAYSLVFFRVSHPLLWVTRQPGHGLLWSLCTCLCSRPEAGGASQTRGLRVGLRVPLWPWQSWGAPPPRRPAGFLPGPAGRVCPAASAGPSCPSGGTWAWRRTSRLASRSLGCWLRPGIGMGNGGMSLTTQGHNIILPWLSV